MDWRDGNAVMNDLLDEGVQKQLRNAMQGKPSADVASSD